MELTSYNKWPLPDENKDPWFQDFIDLLKEIDANSCALLNTAGNIIIPLGTVSWNASFKEVTWTDDFLIPLQASGYFLRVKFGPDQSTRKIFIDNGERLIIKVPNTSSEEVIGYVDKMSGAGEACDPTILTLGFIYDNKLFANLPTVISST